MINALKLGRYTGWQVGEMNRVCLGSSERPLWRETSWAKMTMQGEPGGLNPRESEKTLSEAGLDLVCLRNKRKPVWPEGNGWKAESWAWGSERWARPRCHRSSGPTGLIFGQNPHAACTVYSLYVPPGCHHWLPLGKGEGTPGGSTSGRLASRGYLVLPT